MDSMKGKRVVITGPTSGIGKQIAFQLGALGASLVLGCRDMGRGKLAAGEISRRTEGAPDVDVMLVDTSSQKSIREFARRYREKYRRLEVLVNNAGINRSEQPRQNSVEGIELTLATNVVGYFLLTRELLNPLEAAAPSRIVNVASTFASEPDLGDLQFHRRPFDGMKAYSESKACDRLLTWAFARRLAENGITANAMAPGLVPETNLFGRMSAQTRGALHQRGGFTAAQGADTAVWLASSPDVKGVSGKFFERRQEIPCEFRNTEMEEKLWNICEALVVFTETADA
jgi:NAD(P)-dependent dehydrogenase (short-subunit alcohol dehydrogenase family)